MPINFDLLKYQKFTDFEVRCLQRNYSILKESMK